MFRKLGFWDKFTRTREPKSISEKTLNFSDCSQNLNSHRPSWWLQGSSIIKVSLHSIFSHSLSNHGGLGRRFGLQIPFILYKGNLETKSTSQKFFARKITENLFFFDSVFFSSKVLLKSFQMHPGTLSNSKSVQLGQTFSVKIHGFY